MSGGLLDRVEDEEEADEPVEAVETASIDGGLLSREKSGSSGSSSEITMADSLKMIGLVMILPFFLIMWFDVYFPFSLSSYMWLIVVATAGIAWWQLDIGNPL
ncbi:MAG TPA: hypothetical protein QF555_03230, partial [Candidatus Thalassarchaeaceae archaeon]|nr:hypothetical protein [Candidatus Thalassarchaeaceae archaeon]